MKLNDLVGLTHNKRNNQFSLNIKARQLKKMGITHQNILDLKIPKELKIIKSKREVK